MQREQVAVHEELEPLRPLRGRGGEEIRRVHEPVRRGVVLVEPHAVVPEPVHRLPGGEVLGVRADGHIRLEVPPGQGPRQLLAVFQMVQMLAVGQQVEDEDVHERQVCSKRGRSARPRPAIIQG